MEQLEKKVKTEENNKEKLLLAKKTADELGMILPKNIADKVFNTLISYEESNQMNFPKEYSLGNALRSAWLTISGDNKLNACDNTSIANSLLQMAVLGVSPSKSQCYFIPMGNKCTLIPSYFGKVAIAKRIKGVIDVRSDVIYKDTEYELSVDDFGNDDITIIKPCPLNSRKKENIEGAWSKIILDENVWGAKSYCAILTVDDIKNSWSLGNAKGNSKAHELFFGEMAKKTAINRCIKNFNNTRCDQDVLSKAIKETIDNEYKETQEENEEYNNVKKNIDLNNVFEAEVVEEKHIQNTENDYENVDFNDIEL